MTGPAAAIRRLDREVFESTWTIRPDAPAKVWGRLRYLTDELDYPGLLHARLLRSPLPHARVRELRVAAARALPGVHAVITAADIPGLNRFGIVIQDQPVFCEDRVRYVGDAIAAVAAETPERAAEALALIEVDYEPLPVVDSAERALAPDAPALHPAGNLLQRVEIRQGDVEAAFARCSVVVEETYLSPRQMHVFTETEGGVVVPEADGGLTFRVGSQHPHRDRLQLARILGLPEAKLRIVSAPTGGAFGGKDELTVQPAAGLLALLTGRPIRIHLDRGESSRAGIKRHPVKLYMRTGCDADGRILAHQMRAMADTGAYASLGPSVLENILEHGAAAAYDIPNLDVEASLVYTNNGVAGAFRGFGGNQGTFAVEGQLDRLAHRLGIAPAALRRRNLREPARPGVRGQVVRLPCPGDVLLDAGLASPLWTQAKPTSGRWREGVGLAIGLQGNGLGSGLPDPGGGRLCLRPDGRIELAFGFVEFGQGVLPAVQALAVEALQCAPEDLDIRLSDSATPESGSTSASRTTVVAVEALRRLREPWRQRLLLQAEALSGLGVDDLQLGPGGIWPREGGLLLNYAELAAGFAHDVLPDLSVEFGFPVGPDPEAKGRFLYAWIVTVARVRVDVVTGRIKVTDMHHITAAGRVIHPPSYLGQIEGAAVMGLGLTLMEDVAMRDGQYLIDHLDGYMVPTIADAPRQRLDVIEDLPADDGFELRGVGELGIEAISPAITAAIHDAVGVLPAQLPVRPAALLAALRERQAESAG